MKSFFSVRDTWRGTQSYMEKRRGRRELEVTRRRGGIKRGKSKLASNHFPMLSNVLLEKPLESSLDWKEIKPVNPKGNQPWIFIGRTVFEVALFWPPDSKSQFIGTEPIHGKDERQKDKGMEEDEMVRHWWLTVKRVRFMTSEGKNFTFGWKAQLQSLRALCSKSFITVKKEYKNFWHRHQKGAESAPFTYFSGALYNFSIYQTHSHNRHLKVTGLVRKFLLRRRKNFSNKIHYCYAIISTEHK